MLLPSLTLMHLTGSNDMLQSLETVGPAITNIATEGFSLATDLISFKRLRVQALRYVHFLTALSCYLVLRAHAAS